jgi:hypothetical protein
MTARQAIAFVKANGIVLESASGPAPSLAAAIVGKPIRGSWWKHPKASQIFRCTRAIRDSKEVLVCRLLGGKVTYVHRRLWPALVRLHDQFRASDLAAIREIHTDEGKHELQVTAFPKWVAAKTIAAAKDLTVRQAAKLLGLVDRSR